MRDGFIKAAAVTPKVKVADVAFNKEQILLEMKRGAEDGAADIVFTYHTPGLALSAGVSLTGLGVYAGYLLLLHFKRKRKQNADPC